MAKMAWLVPVVWVGAAVIGAGTGTGTGAGAGARVGAGAGVGAGWANGQVISTPTVV